jgi:hypothetical protein
MSETVETLYNEAKTRRVRIVYDIESHEDESPFERGDGWGAVIPSGARFTLTPNTQDRFQSEFDRFNDEGRAGLFARWLKIFHGLEARLLYRYDHSMVAYSVQSFAGRAQHADWDSGPCGFVYFAPEDEETRQWWDGLDEEAKAKAYESLGQEATDWSNNNYYGYIVERRATGTKVYDDDTEDEEFDEWAEEDSLWGMLGYDYAEQEAKRALEEEE